MRLLLDTCTLLWAWAEPGKLSEHVQGLLEDPHNKVWVSAASAWEIATFDDQVEVPIIYMQPVTVA